MNNVIEYQSVAMFKWAFNPFGFAFVIIAELGFNICKKQFGMDCVRFMWLNKLMN
jgi:hypothetical protein